MNGMSLGLEEALRLTLEAIKPLSTETVTLLDSVDRIAASDLYALVDSPSTDASLKDGYAVLSREVALASDDNPVRLRCLGSIAAGEEKDIKVRPGEAVKVLTGAHIPTGADAVVSEEFVKQKGSDVLIRIFAEPGRNILPQGSDVALGKCVLHAGQCISPGIAGLLAGAGHSMIPVVRNPVVGIVGTGDEIVEPGQPLTEGKLYASNITTIAGWCNKQKMKTLMVIVKDDYSTMLNALKTIAEKTDVLITSGGAWTGDRDMVARVLDELGWQQLFHRIRIGPGKAVGFGTLNGKPVFILPGGPSSNIMGFLQIALPGLHALSGYSTPGLPRINARLDSELKGRESDWTQFFFGTLEHSSELPIFYPLKKISRLTSISDATAIASIPEGEGRLQEGSVVSVQLLG